MGRDEARAGAEQEARKATYGPRLRELVASIDPKPRFAQVPPKALCLINGGRDEYIDIESVRRFVTDLKPLYREDQGRLRFVPFPEAGHGVTDGYVEGGPGVDRSGTGEEVPGGQDAMKERAASGKDLPGSDAQWEPRRTYAPLMVTDKNVLLVYQ